jgi:hypothetical protein
MHEDRKDSLTVDERIGFDKGQSDEEALADRSPQGLMTHGYAAAFFTVFGIRGYPA